MGNWSNISYVWGYSLIHTVSPQSSTNSHSKQKCYYIYSNQHNTTPIFQPYKFPCFIPQPAPSTLLLPSTPNPNKCCIITITHPRTYISSFRSSSLSRLWPLSPATCCKSINHHNWSPHIEYTYRHMHTYTSRNTSPQHSSPSPPSFLNLDYHWSTLMLLLCHDSCHSKSKPPQPPVVRPSTSSTQHLWLSHPDWVWPATATYFRNPLLDWNTSNILTPLLSHDIVTPQHPTAANSGGPDSQDHHNQPSRTHWQNPCNFPHFPHIRLQQPQLTAIPPPQIHTTPTSPKSN